MKVLMIGGTGYLGYFAVDELIKLKYEVTVIGLPPPPPAAYFNNKRVEIKLIDISTLDQMQLEQLLSGFQIVIYAGGADGRNRFPAPAINGFRKENVDSTIRLTRAASNAWVKKLIILGSYYTAIARIFHELDVKTNNPYILSRIEQTSAAFDEAGSALDVIVLELPYIFGAAPGKGTLWGFYIKLLQENMIVPVPSGGTACITARQVGQAIAGACNESIKAHRRIAIADSNHSYESIYRMFCNALGITRTFVTKSIEDSLTEAKKQRELIKNSGMEGAYDPVSMVHLQNNKLYIDPAAGMELLGYSRSDMNIAINETVEATLKFI